VVARACSCGRTGLDAERFSLSSCCWALEERMKIFQSWEPHQARMRAGIQLGQRCCVQEGWQMLPSNEEVSGTHLSPLTFHPTPRTLLGEETKPTRGSETSRRCWQGGQTKGGAGGAQHGKPALLCRGMQGSALAKFTLPKNEGLAVSTEINPYGNLVSDATLRRRFLFPITLLISARKNKQRRKSNRQ